MDLKQARLDVLDEARAGAIDDAIALADRLIEAGLASAEAGSKDEQHLSTLMMTRIGLRAELRPSEDVFDECRALIARCRTIRTSASILTSFKTLEYELAVLLRDPEDARISDVAGGLTKAYSKTAAFRLQLPLAQTIISAVDRLTGRGHAAAALPLARQVADRLATLDGEPEQLMAASAQLWVLIALAYGGEQLAYEDALSDPHHTIALLSGKSDAELGEFTAAATELEKLNQLGDISLVAADSMLTVLQARDGWGRAQAVTLTAKILILLQLGHTDEAESATTELLALEKTAAGAEFAPIIAALREEIDRS